jgi:uncharacterized integral membrane protein (TIGR00697 family)
MDHILVVPFIIFLQSFSGETLSVILFLTSVGIILGLFRVFGLHGLYAYSIIATILANIQVLKVGQFILSPEPVALGTITFATLYLVSDMITEHYGKKAAQKAVWLSFFSQIVVMILMILTLGHAPERGDSAHRAMEILFLPAPRLVVASLISFVVSLWLEIWSFQALRELTHTNYLWLRTGVSTIFAAFLDTVIFSTLAWVVFSPTPISIDTLFFTYILGTFVARFLVAIVSTPVLYLSYLVKPVRD